MVAYLVYDIIGVFYAQLYVKRYIIYSHFRESAVNRVKHIKKWRLCGVHFQCISRFWAEYYISPEIVYLFTLYCYS